ncbi:hypothetical protein BZF66_06890 [Salmonella enterica]|uniref:hypothetical protein n=1 Tax=Salmonella enterica TaxID=28901 RepID=UPI000FDF84DF|nr:hypothetical protein CPT_Munch_239 [Salmonella phage Munch]EAZ2023023.1 hypothetical protein [Salmonella enterica]EHX8550476.1 hypothetical protein [Salmonella enterica]ELL7856618.1 hypothetical protein [Salmonella enterica]MCP0435739.1 hypothetical protein [Salmonella enterica subsp. enterica serovar Mbandaka]
MTKKINEASIKLDVNGLESEDFETLSRMLALAGQAETNTGSVGTSGLAPLKPMDFDSIGDEEVGSETQPIMNPADAMAPVSPADGAAELGDAIDDLAGTVSDFGADTEESEMSLDMDGQPSVSSESEFEDDEELGDIVGFDDVSMELDDNGDDEFDMSRMSELAGLGESLITEDDSAAEEVVDTDAREDEDLVDAEEDAANEELDESQRILPDLSLEEDSSEAEQSYGPFNTEREAVEDGMRQTNGVEGDNFIIVPQGNAYYWKRTVHEELQNEPEPEFFDNDGIENSRHNYRHKRTALGDNPLLHNVRESEEVDADNDKEDDNDDEDVEQIYESIAAQYEKFLGGLNGK